MLREEWEAMYGSGSYFGGLYLCKLRKRYLREYRNERGMNRQQAEYFWSHFANFLRENPWIVCLGGWLMRNCPDEAFPRKQLFGRRWRNPLARQRQEEARAAGKNVLEAEFSEVQEEYYRLKRKHPGVIPSWKKAILLGRARELVRHNERHDSAWGKRMRRQKGGLHVQQRYRQEGWHPLPSVRKAWGLEERRGAGET